MYFELVKKYKEQYGVKVYAYSLMPSHLHLLMEVDEKTTISTLMHNINSSYTKYYNGRYQRKGHLFRERFKAALIEKDPKVLLNLTAYIHLNPKKLEIATLGETYPYSSYSLYLDYKQESDHGLDIKDEISEMLSNLIGENYSQYMKKVEQTVDVKKMHKQLQRKGMFGSEKFINEVKKHIEELKEQTEEQASVNGDSGAAEKQKPGLGAVLLVLVLTTAGIYVYFNYSAKTPVETKEKIIIKEVEREKEENIDQTEWDIKLTSKDGKEIKSDTISFVKGKIISKYLTQLNYQMSNYSQVIEGDKIIWETMQSSPLGTASWRGEINGDDMSGILSLRQKGTQQQVFYFKSIAHRKKMGGLK